MAITPREGQIRKVGLSGSEIRMTDVLISIIYRENRGHGYRYVRTPIKVRIRHFFQDLLRKLRK